MIKNIFFNYEYTKMHTIRERKKTDDLRKEDNSKLFSALNFKNN